MTAAALLARIDAQCSDATRAIKRAAREPQSEIWASVIQVAMEHHATLRALRVAVSKLEWLDAYYTNLGDRWGTSSCHDQVRAALAEIARLLEQP